MNRRTFLKIIGMGSISVAAGCTPDPYDAPRPDKTLYSLVHAPDDMVVGEAAWYATTCRECPAGCGVLAKNREGRVVKVEGNPLHPINRGKLCMRGQAALQGIYDPDRLRTPLRKTSDGWQWLTYHEAALLLKRKIEEASTKGPNRIHMVTETVGRHLLRLFTEALAGWQSPPPLVFEPFAYESLKWANARAFGVNGLPSYRIEEADVLVSFGADFLETWLSPVEYARKFKAMHALNDDRKGRFFHVGPYATLTGANADLRLTCRPGSEAALALGLVNEALKLGRASGLPRQLIYELNNAASRYTKENVVRTADVPPEQFEKLVQALIRAQKPLVLGSGIGASGPNAPLTDLAVNYLNLVLDPELARIDFEGRHRVEIAATRREAGEFFGSLADAPEDVLLLNNVNPAYALAGGEIETVLRKDALFVVAFSNFMDETSELADLVFPVRLPLETWDEYGGKQNLVSTLQPAMGRLTEAPLLGDVLLKAAFGDVRNVADYKAFLVSGLLADKHIADEMDWLRTLQRGGRFEAADEDVRSTGSGAFAVAREVGSAFDGLSEPLSAGITFVAAPALRFFDGRGANRPWLCEVPDPLTRVAWQTPVMVHPDTMALDGLKQGDRVQFSGPGGTVDAPVYSAPWVKPGVVVMHIGQGHTAYGRYAQGQGVNPLRLMPPEPLPEAGNPICVFGPVQVKKSGAAVKLAHTDGSRSTYGRKIAPVVALSRLADLSEARKAGLGMWDFPLTLPLPEGYDKARDFYPPHDHAGYRWAMVVDMDRCVGCGACAAACYAENNLGVVGEARIQEGREMAWMSIERYVDDNAPDRLTFMPLMCQHCDNAPCESVCPVFAPHHSKEGINNQIYNRCIGTRFCAQNCPYKVRRFNWFDWQWPKPLNLQLNPNVTVRSKGVMEKCSFCIQRIKEAHDWAKNENRGIRDGEMIPACVQTCPTDALIFGSLMDPDSRVRKLVNDPRAYQIMGYLNTKPAVIYLKKVIQAV
jgi:anaerobic selenocysteine-containing dehydrogenase/Fe-S-cluster-containing dehydrogenase component